MPFWKQLFDRRLANWRISAG